METGKQVSRNGRSTLSARIPVYLSTHARILLWILPLTFFILAFFYPLSRILILTGDYRTFTSANLLRTIEVVFFTFYQAALSTLLSLLVGLPAAYLFARYEFRGKALLRA